MCVCVCACVHVREFVAPVVYDKSHFIALMLIYNTQILFIHLKQDDFKLWLKCFKTVTFFSA